MDDVRSHLTTIFREMFEDESLVLRPEMTAEEVENWDSLSHIDLIVTIETEFGIRFTTGEVSGLRNVGDLETLVRSKTKK